MTKTVLVVTFNGADSLAVADLEMMQEGAK
jgi:hypothetical protein